MSSQNHQVVRLRLRKTLLTSVSKKAKSISDVYGIISRFIDLGIPLKLKLDKYVLRTCFALIQQ